MAIVEETSGNVVACDGCGRSDAGPGVSLSIATYVVFDPNVGSGMARQYCGGCAQNRDLVGQPTIPS